MALPVSSDDPSVRYVVGALVAGVFFGGVAFPTIPSLRSILPISSFAGGVILAVNRFVRSLFNTPAKKILDTVGTRRPMILGFFVQGLVPFGYVLGLNPARYPCSCPTGSSLSPVRLSFSSRGHCGRRLGVRLRRRLQYHHAHHDRGKSRKVGRLHAWWVETGIPGGTRPRQLVTDALGYREAFIVAGVTGLFATVVAALVLSDVNPSVNTGARLRDLPAFVARDTRILTVGTVNFIVRFLFAGVLLSTIVLYADANDISLSGVGASGIVMAVSVLCSSVTTLVVGQYSDSLSNRAVLTVPALGVFGAGFAVLALVPGLLTSMAGVALVGATNPPLLAYRGDLSPADDVGKLGGVYNVFGDLSSTVSPLVVLPVATAVGFMVEYLACVALVAFTAVLAGATLYGESAHGE